ncbi:uncharacterized protein [Amphiura filiformis]|uniref:uncharacterized protein isoform X2 n=1 Tax=Amphiura filiformis TaxID=82378 RepID=UPI003B21A46E
MSRLLLICLAFTACIISVTRAQPILVPVSTRYITTAISTLSQGESKTFIASLCQQFLGETVNSTVLLNNNTSWQPNMGVVYYYIVDDPSKTEKDALCSNTDEAGIPGPYCIVPHWPSTKDLYLKATAGEVAAISFSIHVDVDKDQNVQNKKKDNVNDANARKDYVAPVKQSYSRRHLNADTEYLTEIVTVETNQRLGYLQEALLEITFCPNPFTTDDYKITSTVFGTDGISSYAQYICEKLPCEVDGPNVVGYNDMQVPNNIVDLTTQSGQYSHIYVLVVCWAGQYDPSFPPSGNYVGEFQYSGSLKINAPVTIK